MHSKAHLKSLFKSPEFPTVETKNVFFLNTTLPKQHNHIYFTIFGATNWRYKFHKTNQKLDSKWFSLHYCCRWQVGPAGQGTPHVIDTEQGSGAARCWRGQSSPTANSPPSSFGRVRRAAPLCSVFVSLTSGSRVSATQYFKSSSVWMQIHMCFVNFVSSVW